MMLIRRIILLALFVGAISGCYLPTDFKADLRIKADGNYNFQYQGMLVYVPLLDKIDKNELSRDALTKYVTAVEQDLQRDRNFTEVQYVDKAAFRVRYKKFGNILQEKTFNFVRQNARLLSLARHPNGTISITGDKPNTQIADELAKRGIVMRGTLRIQTEAQVVKHNADEVLTAAAPVHVWNIEGLKKPSPAMVLTARPR
jgi:hypothetical protein